MNRKALAPVLALTLLFAAACQRDSNQNGAAANNANATTNANAAPTPGAAGNPQAAAGDIFSTFPEAQVVMFANGPRIIEAIRRVAPDQFDKMMADAQQQLNFDIRNINFAGMGLRFRPPVMRGSEPDLFFVVKGSVPPEQIINQMKSKAQGGTRQETYNGRTIEILTKRPPYQPPPGSTYTPPPRPQDEIAVVVLGADTVAFGTPDYVRSAIDAAAGTAPRLSPELLNVVTRTSDNLLTIASSSTFADIIRAQGGAGNPDIDRLLGGLRQMNAVVNMTGNDFTLQATIKMDTPDNANLLAAGISKLKLDAEQRMNSAPPSSNPQAQQIEQAVRSILNSVTILPSGDEVRLGVTVPVSTVQSFVQSGMMR